MQSAISLDSEFFKGTSYPTATYRNPQLSHSAEFNCKSIELWGFVEQEDAEKLLGINDDDENDDEKNDRNNVSSYYSAFRKKKKGKTAVETFKDKVYVLDIIDKHYTANLAPEPHLYDDGNKEKPKASVIPSQGVMPTSFQKKSPYAVD